MKVREPAARDWLKTGLYIALAIGTTIVSIALLFPLGPIGVILWLGVAVGSMYLLLRRHARSTVHRCPDCGQEFEIAVLTDFTSPHCHSKKHLRCPECGKRAWATILMRAD